MLTAVGIRDCVPIGFNFAVVLASTFLSGHQMEARRFLSSTLIKFVSHPAIINSLLGATLDYVELSDPEEDEHKLQYAYVLWFSQRQSGKQNNVQPYDQNLKLVGAFNTVEKFWGIYGHLIRPSEMALHSDFHLFKLGIKPMWEVSSIRQRGTYSNETLSTTGRPLCMRRRVVVMSCRRRDQ
ncbi:eukaryotic translation initiation factor 4E type 2 [Trichonephila clavipes]|uniref:Eukaryotic translation initiation factor 4E type 2 n=1 Tax=Trichonephila clavipes TaxID=2585209 RepID=A0A8X6SE90_TRICX|nr:eukaryotic translation initiation factor 4E type 2 [Trichonephila clavipes]